MEGCLIKLQNAIVRRLRSVSGLSFASVSGENPADFIEPKHFDRACEICVLMPEPSEASLYSAGPVFSKVSVGVRVRCEPTRMGECPSVLTAAETVTRSLHFWSVPPESGYSRISLAGTSPWVRESGHSSTITVNFTACAVLE